MKLAQLDRDAIESVLEMGGGYVLDFSDRTFKEFFADFDIPIDDEVYCADGRSKAKRLRTYLRLADAAQAIQVLSGLLDRRLLRNPKGPKPEEVERYRAILTRHHGGEPAGASPAGGEADLLRLPFEEDHFHRLPIEPGLALALVGRMGEATRCMKVEAHLSAIILCGSVLEGMCFGIGAHDPQLVNRGFLVRYKKPSAPPHRDWTLAQWIEVLAHVGYLSPNVEKFAHGVREFRNYVHPREHVASGFDPDAHTVRIGFQVVLAALEDLLKATAVRSEGR